MLKVVEHVLWPVDSLSALLGALRFGTSPHDKITATLLQHCDTIVLSLHVHNLIVSCEAWCRCASTNAIMSCMMSAV